MSTIKCALLYIIWYLCNYIAPDLEYSIVITSCIVIVICIDYVITYLLSCNYLYK